MKIKVIFRFMNWVIHLNQFCDCSLILNTIMIKMLTIQYIKSNANTNGIPYNQPKIIISYYL